MSGGTAAGSFNFTNWLIASFFSRGSSSFLIQVFGSRGSATQPIANRARATLKRRIVRPSLEKSKATAIRYPAMRDEFNHLIRWLHGGNGRTWEGNAAGQPAAVHCGEAGRSGLDPCPRGAATAGSRGAG